MKHRIKIRRKDGIRQRYWVGRRLKKNYGNMPDFKSYQEASEFINKRAKEYRNKNEYFTTDEYKSTYPVLQKLRNKELANLSEKAKLAMVESKVKEGDQVEYNTANPFGQVFDFKGNLKLDKEGIPYVHLDESSPEGKKKIRWHKGFRKTFGSFGRKEVKDGKIPYRIEYSEDGNWKPAFEGYIRPQDLDNTFKELKTKTFAPYWRGIREDLEGNDLGLPSITRKYKSLDPTVKGDFFKLRGTRTMFGKITDFEGIADRDDIERMGSSKVWNVRKMEQIPEQEFQDLRRNQFDNFGWSDNYNNLFIKDKKVLGEYDMSFSDLVKTRNLHGLTKDKKIRIDLDKLQDEKTN